MWRNEAWYTANQSGVQWLVGNSPPAAERRSVIQQSSMHQLGCLWVAREHRGWGPGSSGQLSRTQAPWCLLWSRHRASTWRRAPWFASRRDGRRQVVWLRPRVRMRMLSFRGGSSLSARSRHSLLAGPSHNCCLTCRCSGQAGASVQLNCCTIRASKVFRGRVQSAACR